MRRDVEVLDKWTEMQRHKYYGQRRVKFRIIRNVDGRVYVERWTYNIMTGWRWVILVDFDAIESALVNRVLMLKEVKTS
jgi:hypothetical protein